MIRRVVMSCLFVAGLLWVSVGSSVGDDCQGKPTASVKLSKLGDPVQSGAARVDGSWDKCGDATESSIIVYRKGDPATEVYRLITRPAGNKGSNGGDISDNKQMKKGDTIYAEIKIYNGANVVAEAKTADFEVP